MKIAIYELNLYVENWMVDLELIPETLEEAAILLRLTCRRRKTMPFIRTSFCDEIMTNIQFKMNNSSNARDTGIK